MKEFDLRGVLSIIGGLLGGFLGRNGWTLYVSIRFHSAGLYYWCLNANDQHRLSSAIGFKGLL